MTREEVLTRLCYYDLRNPNGVAPSIEYYTYDDETDVDTLGEHAKEDCSCDNCFYGRTILAEYILTLKEIV